MSTSSGPVVVTGGTGFLGRHVTAELAAHGYDVRALGSRDYDLRSRADIAQMLADHKPASVIHLAAVVGGIGANRVSPGRFFYENAIMGIELLEACRVAKVPKVVVAGTVCAYPKFAPVPFSEDGLWDGYPEETNAPYGVAKKALLVQAQSYRQEYGTNIVFLLPANLYGPGDNFDLDSSHVIPAMIRKFLDASDGGDDVTLWGDGSPTREFLHARDAARGFRLALERYDGADPINLGTGREVAIADLAGMVAKATGFDGSIRWDTSMPNGQPRRALDASRAEAEFGFTAEVPLEDGIAETVAWYLGQVGAAG